MGQTSPFFSPCLWNDEFAFDVQIFDTDCYGVMWHGSYTKWLEMGRVKLLEKLGIKLSLPTDPEGYVYPVAEQTFRFKTPARYGDSVKLVTGLHLDGFKLYFRQAFFNVKNEKTILEAETLNLVVNMNWKLQRQIPKQILEKLTSPVSLS